ncbi:hypothetical protein CC2G_006317 [Coprinopsis cinerea AmutBmut pab1-1]|nr:hypothetical protein CC2G_006317 [Coprinopsis cinerea AmutBmut pab1-1]
MSNDGAPASYPVSGAPGGVVPQPIPNLPNSGLTIHSMSNPTGLAPNTPQQYPQFNQGSLLGERPQAHPPPSQNPLPTPTSNLASSAVTGSIPGHHRPSQHLFPGPSSNPAPPVTVKRSTSGRRRQSTREVATQSDSNPPAIQGQARTTSTTSTLRTQISQPLGQGQPTSTSRRGKFTVWVSTEPIPSDVDEVQVGQVLGSTIVHKKAQGNQPSVLFVNHTPDTLRSKYEPKDEETTAATSSSAPAPTSGNGGAEASTSLPTSLPAHLREKLLDPKFLERLGKSDPRSITTITDIFQTFHDKLTEELARTAPTCIQQEPLKEAKTILISWGLQYVLNNMTTGMIVSQEDLEQSLTKRLNSGDVIGHVCQAWKGAHSKVAESRSRSGSTPTCRRPRSTSPSRMSRPRSVSSPGLNARPRLYSRYFATDDYTLHFSPEVAKEIKEHLLTDLSIFLTDNVTAPFIEGMVDHALRLLVDLFPELRRFFDSTAGFDITDLINVILNIALSGCYMHYYGTKPDGVDLPFMQTEYQPHPTTQESFQIVLCLRANTMVAKNREPYVLHFRSGGVVALFTWMVRGFRSLVGSSPNPVLERLAGQGCHPPLDQDFMDQALVLPIAIMSMALYGCYHFRSLNVKGSEILESEQCRNVLSRKLATAGSALRTFVKEDPVEYAELRRHLLHCVDMYTTPAPIPAPLDLGLTWTVGNAVHLNFGRPLLAHASHVALHEEHEMDDTDGDSVSTNAVTSHLANIPDPDAFLIPRFDNRPSAQRRRLFEALRPPEPRPIIQARKRRRSNSL